MYRMSPELTLFERVLREIHPGAIETDEQDAYFSLHINELRMEKDQLTAAETKMMKLLEVLIRDYDQRRHCQSDRMP